MNTDFTDTKDQPKARVWIFHFYPRISALICGISLLASSPPSLTQLMTESQSLR